MRTLAKTRSEVSYLLSETSHGFSPKARKLARKMQRKLLRATDQQLIAQGLRDHAIEQADAEVEAQEAMLEDLDELMKLVQVESMWHNHEIERSADQRWDEDSSWHEDAEEFFEDDWHAWQWDEAIQHEWQALWDRRCGFYAIVEIHHRWSNRHTITHR